MDKNQVVTKYELVIIVDANAAQDKKDELAKAGSDAVEKAGGKVINSSVWIERQKMTFAIKKCNEGTYFLVNFEGEGSTADKVKATLKLNESILRFMITKVD